MSSSPLYYSSIVFWYKFLVTSLDASKSGACSLLAQITFLIEKGWDLRNCDSTKNKVHELTKITNTTSKSRKTDQLTVFND